MSLLHASSTPEGADAADDDELADADASEATPDQPDNGAPEAEEVAVETLTDDAASPPLSGARPALVLGAVAAVALAGLTGWLGYRASESYEAQQQPNLFLQVGRQAAVNLTTIRSTEADTDVQRILDSATGPFYDDFRKRSPAFIDVVKRAQSTSEGTVTEAGLLPSSGDAAQILVALTVKTWNAATGEQPVRAWRMRITVQNVGDGAKVSKVAFIP